MRALLLLLLVSLATLLCAQETPAGEGSALSFSRSVNVPLNGVQLYDKALDAWNWTFGPMKQGPSKTSPGVVVRARTIRRYPRTWWWLQARLAMTHRAQCHHVTCD